MDFTAKMVEKKNLTEIYAAKQIHERVRELKKKNKLSYALVFCVD